METACRRRHGNLTIAPVRAAPDGLIAAMLKIIRLLVRGREPLAVSYYYAAQPTSLDRTCAVSPEFVDLARNQCTAASRWRTYFTDNLAAGAYNDGIADNRELFVDRVHDAMVAAEHGA